MLASLAGQIIKAGFACVVSASLIVGFVPTNMAVASENESDGCAVERAVDGARTITLGAEVTGTFAALSAATVYYRFNLSEGGLFSVEGVNTEHYSWSNAISSSSESTAVTLRVYDGQGNELDEEAFSHNSVTDQCNFEYETYLSRGTYYLSFSVRTGLWGTWLSGDGAHTFTASLEPADETYPEAQAGDNDTLRDATPAALWTTVQGVLGLGDDRDFYSFTIDKAMPTYFGMNAEFEDCRAYVYDGRGNEVARIDLADYWEETVGVSVYISNALWLEAGTYYVCFEARSDERGAYMLIVDPHAFSDVTPSAWYYESVSRAFDAGIMNGYAGTDSFGPNDPLTREQAATVMWNALGNGDLSAPAAPLSDVVQGQWYAPYVNWAYENELMSGYGGMTLFGVGGPLTREQFATVLANAAGASTGSASTSILGQYRDGASVSGWARQTMAWAVDRGILSGVAMPDGTRELQPTRTVTRAEMATMVMNAIDAGVIEG